MVLKYHTIYKILKFISELEMLAIYSKKKLIRNVKRIERTNKVAVWFIRPCHDKLTYILSHNNHHNL